MSEYNKLFGKSMALFVCMALFFSCTPDTCKNVFCGEFGTCEDGECFCEEGYTKDENGSCKLRFRDLVIDEWVATSLCDTVGSSIDSAEIAISSNNINEIAIIGWRGTLDTLFVTVDTYNYTIAKQSPDNNNIYFEGTGVYDQFDDIIMWNYTVTDERNLPAIFRDSCTASWTR